MYTNNKNTFNNIGDLSTNNDDGCTYGWTSNPNGWGMFFFGFFFVYLFFNYSF